MRAYNVHHSDDPVRLLGLDVAADDMGVLERLMARNVLSWHMSTGHKVLLLERKPQRCWARPHRRMGSERGWSHGTQLSSNLREQLGSAYVSAR
jgi:erythromycin esterase